MRRLLHRAAPFFLIAAPIGVFLCAAAAAATPPIEPGKLLGHIKFLASDDLQGRGNGSDGLERASLREPRKGERLQDRVPRLPQDRVRDEAADGRA